MVIEPEPEPVPEPETDPTRTVIVIDALVKYNRGITLTLQIK